MKIITEKITKKEFIEKHSNYFKSLTKAVVDIKKEVIAVDADLHADLETLLLEDGSRQDDLWGINLYPQNKRNDFIEYTSLINIRPHQDNSSMEVKNPAVRDKINTIVDKLIDYGA